MLETAEMPSSFPPFARVPLYPTFEEHYYTGDTPLPHPASDDGLKNAWLPRAFFWSRRPVRSPGVPPRGARTDSDACPVFQGAIEVSDGEQYRAIYRTFDGVSQPEDPVTDVIITGEVGRIFISLSLALYRQSPAYRPWSATRWPGDATSGPAA